MGESICSIRDCKTKVSARGLCQRHYGRAYRTGNFPPMQLEISLKPAHVLSKVNQETATADCSICGPGVRIRLRKRSNGRCDSERMARLAALKATRTPEQRRRSNLRTKYGLTQAQYDKMVADQDGCCLICRDQPKGLVVDHDHDTGRVRGLLCLKCNAALGLLRDDPAIALAASQYLTTRLNEAAAAS